MMNLAAVELPRLVIFWLLTCTTVFAGWSIVTMMITDLKKETKWEVRIIYYLGRIMVCKLALATFLLGSWGLMALSMWVFTQ